MPTNKTARSLFIPSAMALGLSLLLSACSVDENAAGPVIAEKTVTWAEQGWTETQRNFYHYTSQGTVSGNVTWFMALEQAGSQKLFSEPAYLASFGFMNEAASSSNPLGLPIGFAVAPADGQSPLSIAGTWGLTCAACHSGEINYQGNKLRIDGAQAQTNLPGFSYELQQAMLANYNDKDKWARFEKRVLGPSQQSAADLEKLRSDFGSAVSQIENRQSVYNSVNPYPTPELIGRGLAAGQLSNNIFGFALGETAPGKNLNQFPSPTDYPTVWDIWKLDWVQYGGEVSQPMGRNLGETLGVGARTNFVQSAGGPNPGHPNSPPDKWITSANIPNIAAIEKQLQSLRPPLWPENLLGKPDPVRATQGQKLFEQLCVSCHGVQPIAAPGNLLAKWAVTLVPLNTIGTDPQRSFAWDKNSVDGSKMTGKPSPDLLGTSAGLSYVTDNVKTQAYASLGLTLIEQKEYDGFGRPALVRDTGSYKAKPLDGVWSSAPYLHNGSVPNMYQLLSPVQERPETFWVSSSPEYDPETLGIKSAQTPGANIFDTKITGNSNSGHEFSNEANKKGVIGRLLEPSERMALIEYLKVLPQMPPAVNSAVPLDYFKYERVR